MSEWMDDDFEATDTDRMGREAEQAVLGKLILDNTNLHRISWLDPADFDSPFHRDVFSKLKDRIVSGSGVDTFTLQEVVEGDRDWAYLADCAHNQVPSNVDMYAAILRNRRARKSLAFIGQQLVSDAKTGASVEEITGRAVVEIYRAQARRTADMDYTQAVALLDEHRARDEGAISSTLPGLDHILGGGFQPAKLYVLGARPGLYKSALGQQIAMRADANGRKVGILSLEMPPEEIAHRGIQGGYGRTGGLRIDAASFDIEHIAAAIADWRYQHGVELVVIDYLQLIGGKARSRFELLAEVSRRLKLLSREFGVAILALAQVSREVERENRPPRLSDLRECGNIEQDADVVLFIWRDDEDYVLAVAKQRSGMARAKPILLAVDGPRFRVRELA